MRDRGMQSGTELAREIKVTDWTTTGNLSNRSSGVQIPRDICPRLKCYLYSAKCSWIIINRELLDEVEQNIVICQWRMIIGNIGPWSYLYGPRFARSVLPQARANISQHGPRARLVRG